MKIDIDNKKRYKLIMVGRSNWDFYLDNDYPSIYAVAKPSKEHIGCVDSYFGNIKFFKKWFMGELQKDPTLYLTAKGNEIIQ